jgi:gluconokinase
VTQVRATGGVMRSELWRSILAATLDMRLDFAEGPEGSGFGAALLGMDALGLIDSIDVAADLIPVTDQVTPDPADAAVYRQLQPVFDELYDRLVPTFQSLRRLEPMLPIGLEP